ncbi:hypothetical protein VPH35_135976 [Triticum aestivum]
MPNFSKDWIWYFLLPSTKMMLCFPCNQIISRVTDVDFLTQHFLDDTTLVSRFWKGHEVSVIYHLNLRLYESLHNLRVLHRRADVSLWYALMAGVAMTPVLQMVPEAEGQLRGCTSYNSRPTFGRLGEPNCRGVVP